MNAPVNLMPEVESFSFRLRREYRRWRLIWLMALIVGSAFLLMAGERRRVLQDRLASLERLEGEAHERSIELRAIAARLGRAREELSVPDSSPDGIEPIGHLLEIVDVLERIGDDEAGPRVVFSRTAFDAGSESRGDSIVLSGDASDRAALAALIEELDRLDSFGPPQVRREPSDEDAGMRRWPFMILLESRPRDLASDLQEAT